MTDALIPWSSQFYCFLQKYGVMIQRFCKYVSGVHRNTTNLAIYGELEVYPLNIDIKTKMILCHLHLKNQESKLLIGALAELQKLN